MQIELQQVSKHFERDIFKDLSLTVESGEFVAIKGQSGRGKTTLLNIIGGIESIDKGRVLLGNIDFSNPSARLQTQIYQHTLSFIFQNYGLLENETIKENLAIILRIHKVAKSKQSEKIHAALVQVGLSEIDLMLTPYSLSGGEQQRLAIARAILADNPIILADEPTGSLDEKNGDNVMGILSELNRQGKTIVVVTHSNRYDSIFHRIVTL